MPPKKKSKTRDASSPAAGDAPTPTAATPSAAKEAPPAEPVISDGWTDEQETTLFKAISVYNMKPAGKGLLYTGYGILAGRLAG
jgi:MRG-binding protein